MKQKKGILAIDQGTASSRAIVFDDQSSIVSVAQREFEQLYPDNGWIEHNPDEIWSTTVDVCRTAIAKAEVEGVDIVAIGTTNQRETTVLWGHETGAPLYNAIVWQDRRTAEPCDDLRLDGIEQSVSERTGLLLDPYFSATKASWILDATDGARTCAENGAIAFGTIDMFLLWKLTGGTAHKTDATNASRTSLYNIRSHTWDEDLLRLFNVPAAVLPEVCDCSGEFGKTKPGLFGKVLPILSIAGD